MIRKSIITFLLFIGASFISYSNSFAQGELGKIVTPITQQVVLTETEFNELLIASLTNDANGQQLLALTDNINTKTFDGYVELAGIVNLDKVEKINPQARQSFEQFDRFLFFLDKNRLNITVTAIPVVRNGLIGIKDNFTIELGPIPISNQALRQLGVQVAQVNHTNLKLNGLTLKSIQLGTGKVILESI